MVVKRKKQIYYIQTKNCKKKSYMLKETAFSCETELSISNVCIYENTRIKSYSVKFSQMNVIFVCMMYM